MVDEPMFGLTDTGLYGVCTESVSRLYGGKNEKSVFGHGGLVTGRL